MRKNQKCPKNYSDSGRK